MHRPLNAPGTPREARRPRARPHPRPRGAAGLAVAVSAGLFVAMAAPVDAIAGAGDESARPSAVGGSSDGSAVARPDVARRAGTPRASGYGLFRSDPGGARASGSDGWWSGKVCAALVLAVCGVIAVAARRRGSRTSAVAAEVVGRVSLSPKHAVYLLRIGRRVLVVGAGPQGPPALITELDDVPQDVPAERPEAGS